MFLRLWNYFQIQLYVIIVAFILQEAECVRKLNAADVLKVSRTIQLFVSVFAFIHFVSLSGQLGHRVKLHGD